MIYRECPCPSDDGCADCGHTGYQRQCDTCSEWFPAEHAPQKPDRDEPCSCGGCWHACHMCTKPAGWVALVWLDDEVVLGRSAMEMRLCDACFNDVDRVGKIAAGAWKVLKSDGEGTIR